MDTPKVDLKVSSFVPLLEIPLQLIEKYRGTTTGDRVFPMKSNITMNVQLKAIAKRCGIERRLSYHMARHTFATIFSNIDKGIKYL
jgi:integrase